MKIAVQEQWEFFINQNFHSRDLLAEFPKHWSNSTLTKKEAVVCGRKALL